MSFNIAVRSWFFNDSHATEKVDIMPSMIKVTMPTAERRSNPDNNLSPEMLALASRDISLACASRFFEEVHPMYWLFPSEDFYTRFEATYSRAHVPLASSWLCTLHSIVALGASCASSCAGLPNEELARESLQAAKSLVSRVCDQADLDSIRALIALVSIFFSYSAPTAR